MILWGAFAFPRWKIKVLMAVFLYAINCRHIKDDDIMIVIIIIIIIIIIVVVVFC